jgi:hypothetical protein
MIHSALGKPRQPTRLGADFAAVPARRRPRRPTIVSTTRVPTRIVNSAYSPAARLVERL